MRAFISGHVANTMAAEVIALLHNLLTAPVTSTAQTWAEAVQRVLRNALSGLPVLLASTEALGSPRTHALQLMSTAKLANAALAALGAFHETVKPGCAVKVGYIYCRMYTCAWFVSPVQSGFSCLFLQVYL